MKSWRQWTAGSRAWLFALDLVIVAVVAAGSYRLAFRYLTERDVQTLISWEIEPAVMFSCGYGFVHPGGESPERQRFITRQRDAISCDEFAWGGAPTPPIGIALNNRYSIYGAGYAMKLAGVSWRALDGYLAFLFAASMAAVYGLFRQAAGRVLSICGVLAVACSTVLPEIIVLRDFIKLPCFALLWLTLAWMIRRGLTRGSSAIILPMAVGGAGVGLGIGLRMDALILAPPFIAIGLLVIPGFNRSAVRLKAIAVAAFTLMFLATGVPILRSMAGGSNSAHVVVLGLLRYFDPGLGIESAPYDLGSPYSDGFGYTLIASHGLLKQGAQLPILLGSPEYDRIGNRLIVTVARQFPADMMARAISATFQVFRYQFDWRVRDRSEQLHTFQTSPWVRSIVRWRTRALAPFEGREWWLVLGVLALCTAFNWRLGALGLLLIVYFCGYSMLQYARRHTFHLDIIPLMMVVLAVQLPLTLARSIVSAYRQDSAAGFDRLKQHGRQFAFGIAVLAAVMAVAVGAGAAMRWWQQRSVTRLIDTTLAAHWLPVAPVEEPLMQSIIENDAPLPTWQAVYDSAPERWQSATLLRVPGVVDLGTEAAAKPDLRQQYFKVDITDTCDAIEVAIVPSYHAAVHTYDHEYIRSFSIPVSRRATSHLLIPAYYHLGPTWNRLDGFAVAAAQRACITGIYRAQDPSLLPLPVLNVVLPSDWRDRPLYQRIQASPRMTIIGTPVSPQRPRPAIEKSGWRRDVDAPLDHVAPALEQWQASPGVTLTRRAGMAYVVTNDSESDDQIVSPPIDVAPRQLIALQVVGAVVKGSICLGVLDHAGQRRLLAPQTGDGGFVVESRDATRIRLVFTNCNVPSSEFAVRTITYQAFAIE